MLFVSIVIPVYSGENYLRDLATAIASVKSKWENENYPVHICEAIFVDDDSIDQSEDVLRELTEKYSWVSMLELSRNFGQHPATVAGLLHSSGDWVVTLDEDLQHHPDRIIELLQRAVETGSDLIYAKPIGSVHGKKRRDLTSRLFKRLMVWLTGNPYINQANSFRLIRGEVARGAASACNFETYLDIALYWFTSSIEVMEMEMHDERFKKTGKSGYSFRSLISHARRMLVSSQIKLLRIGALLGGIAVVATFALGGFILVQKVINPEAVPIRGWTSTILSLFFFSGVILFMISTLLELVSTLVQSTLGKPSYFLVDRSKDKALKEFFKSNKHAHSNAA